VATFQDASLTFVNEATYKTYVAPTKGLEPTDHSFNWNKQVKQGQGLRVGGRVARSARRVVPAADGGGDFTVEMLSKGMGRLWEAALGTGTSTVVSGATYQQLFTLGDTPNSLTIQTGQPEVGGTVDAYSWLGCMVDSFEINFPNADIVTAKFTIDAGDLSTAQGYVAPAGTYPSSPNLFHFGNGTITTGTVTVPTTTVLGSSTTATANIRSATVQVNNNLRDDRYNYGGAGRKVKPTVGLREITGTLEIEYDSTTYRDLIVSDAALTGVVLQSTGGSLSTGLETFQVMLPAVKLDGDFPKPNGTDLVVQSVKFTCLDDLTNSPIYVVHRTAETTL
jgi:hypothetical protein